MRSIQLIIVIQLLGFLLLPSDSSAHIGSPGVVFEGKAGNYNLLVSISPPEVIPGTANVTVYLLNGAGALVSAKPVYWLPGAKGSPAPDLLSSVPGTSGQYEGIVWLMTRGAASITIQVAGDKGIAEVNVPIMAVATAQNSMSPQLGLILTILGILLAVLLATIFGASMSDGILPAGKEIDPNLKSKRNRGVVIGSMIIILTLIGGKYWWDSRAASYQRYMYKPPQAISTIYANAGERFLRFQIDTLLLPKNRMDFGYLVPDHGKLMHMFLIKEGTLDVFAHVHPKRVDEYTFDVQLQSIPAGKYYVFGDVVRLNGFTETIADTVIIAENIEASNLYSDPDDTIIKLETSDSPSDRLDNNLLICGKPGVATPLQDGSTAFFESSKDQVFTAGKLYPLVFAINDQDGRPALLEPYMGMMAHAVVFRKEGGVYIHLHPTGNYSMASQTILESRMSDESTRPFIPEKQLFMDSVDRVISEMAMLPVAQRDSLLMANMQHSGLGSHEEHGSTVTFHYAFPQPGAYRVWVQMKHKGKVLNSSFDVNVSI